MNVKNLWQPENDIFEVETVQRFLQFLLVCLFRESAT